MMDLVKDCRVMVERLSWKDLQFHKLPLLSSEMSLVNLQRVAIKEEMKDEENRNYDHLSKDDLINELKAKDDRISKLEAECNVLISNMEKEREKTTLMINKQLHEIERLNLVIKELERRIKGQPMEKSGIHQLANDVKTEPDENDSGIDGQEVTLSIVMQQQPKEEIQSFLSTAAEIINDISQNLLDTEVNKLEKSGNGSLRNAEAVNVQGMLGKEDIIPKSPSVSEPQCVAEVGDTNTETKIPLKKAEKMGLNVSVAKMKYSDSLPLCAPSPDLEVKNHVEMSPDSTTESDSPREPLENNINVNDSYRKSQSVSTKDITTRSLKFRVPELNVEVEKHLDLSLEADVESDSLENDLDDNQSGIILTEAKKTDSRQNQTEKLSLPNREFADSVSLSVPVRVPKLERNPNELSELTSVSMEIDVPEVPIEAEKNSSVSDSETFENVALKNSEGKIRKKRSTRFKYSTEYKRGLQRHIIKGNKGKRFKCGQCEYASTRKYDLIAHQRIHSGEKPFKCDHCNYACARKSHLIEHQRIHSGEKPFKCDHCNYACARKSDLIGHQRIHSGEKPFKCHQCEYASTRKSHLIRHQRIHSG